MIEPVQISKKAIAEIKQMMANKKVPSGYGLRVGVKGGGCGVQFVLGFDKPKEHDITYHVSDIPIHIQKKETMFLIGKEVDFYEGADARGFVFVDADLEAK